MKGDGLLESGRGLARSKGGGWLRYGLVSFWSRPKLDELLIVLVAVITFVVYVTLPDGGEEAPIEVATPTPAATAVPTQAPTTAATTAAPTEAVATVAATPTVAATATTEPAVASPDECDFGDVADVVRAATVQVFTDIGSGTAFHIGGGVYVTAAHVIQDESGQTRTLVTLLAGDQSFPATVERQGSFSNFGLQRDLAVLRARAIGAVLETRPPTDDDRDIDVRAFGYPWSSVGDSSSGAAIPLQTSKGVVSAVTLADGIEIIQTDASVDRGMSGGPLVDECGVALAVASFMSKTDDADDPGDFAVFISITELENLD